MNSQPIATFSIVAYDPGRREWGVAVQSKFLAVAALVSWARAGAGAIATQSYVNLSYGSEGLEMLVTGKSAEQVLESLTSADDESHLRQIGIVDRQGRAASFTGEGCHDWKGHVVGDGYACQGNILVPGTVEAMAEAFERARAGPGELSDWLVSALEAGQAAGGDSRGRQAAGVMVVRHNGGYGGRTDRYLDLRVDDDPEPIPKLKQLVELHHLYFGQVDPDDLIPLASVAGELQAILKHTGDYDGPQSGIFDEPTRTALMALVGRENLEERWYGQRDNIDRTVVEFLRERFSQ